MIRLLMAGVILLILLAGCGSSATAPPLADPGQPTLIFIYTQP